MFRHAGIESRGVVLLKASYIYYPLIFLGPPSRRTGIFLIGSFE